MDRRDLYVIIKSRRKELMTKLSELRRRLLTGAFAFVLALVVFGAGAFMTTFVSHAETQVTVTSPKGANVRQSASTSSAAVGGVEKGKVLTVLSQVQGSDGYTWYQIQYNDTTTGYIRSDLVEVSGDAPAEGGGDDTPVEVTEVNPVSASVTEESGKIRSNASSASQILAEVPRETVLTVTGQATDADGKVWYQVSFISEESQVDGFIRSDYVALAEELTPKTEEPAPEESTPEPPAETKPYDVIMNNGDWVLVDYINYEEPKAWPVEGIFNNLNTYEKIVEDKDKNINNQKIIIIILVILLVVAVAGIAFLVFKIRDMIDSAYYNEVENETLRRKNAANGRGGQKVMQTVGMERQSARPVGAKPSGSGQAARPSGASQRQGGASQGTRPAGASQGQRMSGSSQTARTAGASQGQRQTGGVQGARPAGAAQGQRASGASQGARPAGSSQGQRVSGTSQGTRPAGSSQSQRPSGAAPGRTTAASSGARPAQQARSSAQRVQPRNFMEEDDDFEFEFLNYDGDEE